MLKLNHLANNNQLYIIGVRHTDPYDKLTDKMKDTINLCDTLILETNLDDIIDFHETNIPLNERIDNRSYKLLTKFMKVEQIKYMNNDTLIRLICASILFNSAEEEDSNNDNIVLNSESESKNNNIVLNGDTLNVKTIEQELWDKFNTKFGLETKHEHLNRVNGAIELMIPENIISKVLENNLSYIYLKNLLVYLIEIKEKQLELSNIINKRLNLDFTPLQLDEFNSSFKENTISLKKAQEDVLKDDKMVELLHKYIILPESYGRNILYVCGSAHLDGILEHLLQCYSENCISIEDEYYWHAEDSF